MIDEPMLKCGHRANSRIEGKPACVICCGIKEGYKEIAEEPDLSDRECICPMCKKIVPSTEAIAFFEHIPNKEYDVHYDGCCGWN